MVVVYKGRIIAERYAIQNERYKLIWNSELGSELYDLESDPYETLDLSDADAPVATRYLAAGEGEVGRRHRAAVVDAGDAPHERAHAQVR